MFLNLGLSWGSIDLLGLLTWVGFWSHYPLLVRPCLQGRKASVRTGNIRPAVSGCTWGLGLSLWNFLLVGFWSWTHLVLFPVPAPVESMGQENGSGCFAGVTLPHPQPSPEPNLSSPRTSVPAMHPQPLCYVGHCGNECKGQWDCDVRRGADH